MIFNQKIANLKITEEEEPKCRSYCFFRCFTKTKCFGFCECCFGSTCCCCENNSFEQKEINFCLCYQEKRKSEWFRAFMNNDVQRVLVYIVFLMAFLESFIIGLEQIYEEKNERDNNKENMALPLLYTFLCYLFLPMIFYFIYLPLSDWFFNMISKIIKEKKETKPESELKSRLPKLEDIFSSLSQLILYGTVLFIIPVNSISSFVFSIKYFKNKNSL